LKSGYLTGFLTEGTKKALLQEKDVLHKTAKLSDLCAIKKNQDDPP